MQQLLVGRVWEEDNLILTRKPILDESETEKHTAFKLYRILDPVGPPPQCIYLLICG